MINKNKKKRFFLLLVLFFGIGIFSFVAPANAGAEWAGEIIGGLIGWIIGALGIILSLVIQALVSVAQYSNFIGSEAVKNGWVIVRDICNMFFVLILLIIAFATILKLEGYDYKKWLPKLILMAILINFSKTICGLLIDVAQVVMMTFVNAFKDIAAGNLVKNLGLTEVITLANNSADVGFWAIVGAYVLGLIYILISLVVVVTMLAMLVMRIVMIWVYVVLSPAAYLMSAFPGGQKYASQWWSEFTKNLIVGPVLAFFIWLSFVSLQTQNIGNDFKINTADTKQVAKEVNITNTETIASSSLGVTKASTPDVFIRFVIAIGMLIGGLKISQEIGGAAGGMAGKGMAAIQKGQAFAGKMAVGTALLPWKGARLAASYGTDKLHQKTGVDLNVQRVWGNIQEKRKERKADRYTEGQLAARQAMETGGRVHGILAMSGNAGDAFEQLTSWKGVGKALKGGRAMERDRLSAEEQNATDKKRFDSLDYEDEFVNASSDKRNDLIKEAGKKLSVATKGRDAEKKLIADTKSDIKLENDKGIYKDESKIKELENKKAASEARLDQQEDEVRTWSYRDSFVNANKTKVFSDKEKFDIKELKTEAANKMAKSQEKINKNIPEYSFEARAAEQSNVSKKMSKIKDITDADELLRILKDAISSRDKVMVKAITLKMTKDGNDNEFLTPLAGNSGHTGLNKLMRDFADKNSKNYAGFNQQEAFGLGSQIAEINKNTNHAAATAAYTMENGRWRETSNKEHNKIRDIETGKQQLQAFIRNNNRLSYGYHDEKGDFHIDAGGVIKLKAINNAAGFKNLDTMNENAAKYLYDAIKKDPILKAEFGKALPGDKEGRSLFTELEKRLGKLKDTQDFDEKFGEVVRYA